MTEDKIEKLLQKADQSAPVPAPTSDNLAAAVRRRVERRRLRNTAAPLAAAAMLLLSLGIWQFTTKTPQTTQDKEKIASLEAEIKQLQVKTDAALTFIREVLEQEQKQRRLTELHAQLASIPDPLEEIRKHDEKTAFVLVYQADRMYEELNQKDSAIRAYNLVIELYPESQSAETAKQRLAEIENNQLNKKDFKI